MTLPIQVLRGRMVLVTVRATSRRFKFVPTDEVNAIIRYAVAYAAERHGVGIVAMTWLSNHGHLVVNDHEGTLPRFTQTVNMILAGALNAMRGEHGSVFERNNVDYKVIVDREAAITALAYVAANPVEAACVEFGREWPGVRSQAKLMGQAARDVPRPDRYFCHRHLGYRGRLPSAIPMRYELPLCEDVANRGQLLHDVEVAISAAEERARAAVLAKGKTFLGATACRRASHDAQAKSWEPTGPGTAPDPIMATDPAQKRYEEEALAHFHDAYRAAWARWQSGDRQVVFPAGTWLLVLRHRATCAATDSSPSRE